MFAGERNTDENSIEDVIRNLSETGIKSQGRGFLWNESYTCSNPNQLISYYVRESTK